MTSTPGHTPPLPVTITLSDKNQDTKHNARKDGLAPLAHLWDTGLSASQTSTPFIFHLACENPQPQKDEK